MENVQLATTQPSNSSRPEQSEADGPARTALGCVFVAGVLLLGAGSAWDHFGSTAMQRISADKACVQIFQEASLEVHEFKSGYPGGIGDISPEHMKITAGYQCGEAVKTIEAWNDARGAKLVSGEVVEDRDAPHTTHALDLLTWRKNRDNDRDNDDSASTAKPSTGAKGL